MKYVLKKADQTEIEEIFSLYLKQIQWMNEKRNRSVEQQWLSGGVSEGVFWRAAGGRKAVRAGGGRRDRRHRRAAGRGSALGGISAGERVVYPQFRELHRASWRGRRDAGSSAGAGGGAGQARTAAGLRPGQRVSERLL